MTTIDHAAEALDHIHSANIAAGHGEYASSDLEVKTAQVHATLALVEQQRIANLIALGQFRVGVSDLPHLRHLAVEPKGENNLQPVAEIREGLGL